MLKATYEAIYDILFTVLKNKINYITVEPKPRQMRTALKSWSRGLFHYLYRYCCNSLYDAGGDVPVDPPAG